MNVRHLVPLLGAAVLAGCASTAQECDSTVQDPSLFTKMHCDLGGGYQQQVDQQQQSLDAARAENVAFRRVHDDLVAQQQATGKTLAEQQRQQQALNASMDSLLGQLKARHGAKAGVQRQIDDLQRQLSAAKQPVPAANPAQVQARQETLKALQKKVSLLQMSLGYE
ncbi:hypothetical protein G7007_06515 [Pseudomonas entomophila]|jgi:chromosome segregation ATPase|uniref:hypothetical protein n=1 Tax=Pseudomonas entomophila TaxID=312306 RepID=UPI0015E41EAA|nr:hypothetical protein [Pseudomonas entomophila]MBA1192512.1 hypothetical protein [Pseudomonas entomophila]